jgi:hypothetical protein
VSLETNDGADETAIFVENPGSSLNHVAVGPCISSDPCHYWLPQTKATPRLPSGRNTLPARTAPAGYTLLL